VETNVKIVEDKIGTTFHGETTFKIFFEEQEESRRMLLNEF
jgi:hypothetical protein